MPKKKRRSLFASIISVTKRHFRRSTSAPGEGVAFRRINRELWVRAPPAAGTSPHLRREQAPVCGGSKPPPHDHRVKEKYNKKKMPLRGFRPLRRATEGFAFGSVRCEMKFAGIRVSEYFTRRRRISHGEAIFHSLQANFVEKSTCSRKCFFCEEPHKRCVNVGKNAKKVCNLMSHMHLTMTIALE